MNQMLEEVLRSIIDHLGTPLRLEICLGAWYFVFSAVLDQTSYVGLDQPGVPRCLLNRKFGLEVVAQQELSNRRMYELESLPAVDIHEITTVRED